MPRLGDIPISGYLCRYSRTTKTKTNLLIMLTPYVVKDEGDLQRIVARKMRERREFIDTYTSFDALEYSPDVDYRRKRGVVEEINRSVLTVDRERALLREFESQEVQYPTGPVEFGHDEHDGDEAGDGEGADSGGAPALEEADGQ